MSNNEVSAPVFLFLQGPLSSFYSDIGSHLKSAGIDVHKINFCGNDMMDWHHRDAINYQGLLKDWPNYFAVKAAELRVTHIVLHGDRRAYHKPAIEWAKQNNATVFVTELGYLRPDWITVEPWGTSVLSQFPRDPLVIKQIGVQTTPFDKTTKYKDNLWHIIHQEFRWTAFNLLFKLKFPNFETHRSQSPWLVYSGWLVSKLRSLIKRPIDLSVLPSNKPLYVMALQLEGDFQIRENSPFENIAQCIELVVKSFASHANQEAHLILKPHPHEFRYRYLMREIEKISARYNVEDRIMIIKDVPIGKLCERAHGFITINSSAGFEALDAQCPTCTVTQTIYSIEGLTFQAGLDDFWASPQKPDMSLLADLRQALSASIQVRGTLYNRRGLKAAAKGVSDNLLN